MTVTVDGNPVSVPGAAERALLALLVLVAGRPVAATMLIDRLWAESRLPADPTNALQLRVSKLRRALGPHGSTLIVRHHGGYEAAVDRGAVDVDRFASAVRDARARSSQASDLGDDHLAAYDRALALWSGPPLVEFTDQRWAAAEAARLEELHTAALTERCQIALALGRHREVASDLEGLLADNPALESVAALLMVALYRSERQADALDVFGRTRTHLDESLGLEPSASLRSLQQRILRQDPSLGGPQTSTPATVGLVRASRSEDRAESATNLPASMRPLIGREAELEMLSTHLRDRRLTSLIGPGGAGKTSLALAACRANLSLFPDGVMVVRLAPVADPGQVPVAVADSVGVPLDGAASGGDLRERVFGYLARRRMLILLDNCEHVIDAAAGLAEDMLNRCANLTILTTSREALAIGDELQVLVSPLDTPPQSAAAEQVVEYPAAQLFLERAAARRNGFSPTDVELLAIGKICRELDGIPLAIELAAARMAAMTPADIADRLGHRFALLTSGSRTADARQRTLRATVDWSHELLSEPERLAFARLSVFQGGWTLSSAEVVVADDDLDQAEVVEIVAQLVERSLVVVEAGVSARYRMLETLREYAAEQLVERGADTAVRERHARYFLQFTEQADRDLRGHRQRETLRHLRAEQPNIRAALAWFRGPGDDINGAMSLGGALGLFWHLGRHVEGRTLLRELLVDDRGAAEARARALQAVSLVERPRACLVHPSQRCAQAAGESMAVFESLGDQARAALSKVLLAVEGVTGALAERSRELLAEAERQFVADGDEWGLAVIGFVRMETALKTGDETTAVQVGRVTASTFRQLDDPWGLSAILYHLGWGLRQFGRYDEAARVLEEAIDVAAGAGLYNTVQWAHADLGVTHINLGDADAARDSFERARTASENVGDDAGKVLAQYGHALLAQVRGDFDEARSGFHDSAAGFDSLGTPVSTGLAWAGVARCDEAAGDTASAGSRYTDVLGIGRSAGEPGLVAAALEGLARIGCGAGELTNERQLLAEARRIRARAHRPAPPYETVRAAGATGGGTR